MNFRFLFVFAASLAVGISWLYAQQQPIPAENTPPSPKKKNIQEQIKDYEDFKKKALMRIDAIDAILRPAQDKMVFKLFEITPEEYAILKLEADTTDSANKYFSARNVEVTMTQENIATYFDEAYQAIKSGFFLYGQEQALVKQDVELFNRIQDAIRQALLESAKGSEYKALYEEKQQLINDLKDIDPVLRYHMERKNWFKSFPDFKAVLEDALAEKKAAQ